MPVLPPKRARKAVATCDTSILTRASSSVVRPAPPYSCGILCPNRPSSRILCTTGSGISSPSSTCFSMGRHASRRKSRTCASNASNSIGFRIIGFSLSMRGLVQAFRKYQLVHRLFQQRNHSFHQPVFRRAVRRNGAVQRQRRLAVRAPNGYRDGVDIFFPVAFRMTVAVRVKALCVRFPDTPVLVEECAVLNLQVVQDRGALGGGI